ncbi:SecY-interacting protein [Thalassotalea sp. M1531]|uniref:Protein Syd n=1 Tax=Thalassotalea algicola TaxID=2716224 RepID=A0A7Y0Q8U7_9GAMM|nr:SecY-interacting protein [Thalassotalea algicola]NMP33287.1 SecY-interacting protein [Thalassotalea algicola]
MTCLNAELTHQLTTLCQHYVQQFREKHGHLPVVEKDDQWLSPCEQGEYSQDANYWQPVEITDELSFENVEQALGFSLHNDIKVFFTSVYSESFDLTCEEGQLSFVLPWNKDDFDRLQENVIGHILMKQKLKQPITVFFGLTDQDDFILSVNNDSGEVWVEQVGKTAHKKLANNLSEFLGQLTPVIYD